jgi:hypothetical protein
LSRRTPKAAFRAFSLMPAVHSEVPIRWPYACANWQQTLPSDCPVKYEVRTGDLINRQTAVVVGENPHRRLP